MSITTCTHRIWSLVGWAMFVGLVAVFFDTVVFKQVKTGITGTTDIEILEGLTEKERIVTGPYQVLRSLEDNKKVKVQEEEEKK